MSKLIASMSKRQRCMDAGELGLLVDAFTRTLTALGHTGLTVAGYEASARHFGQWLQIAGIAVDGAGVDVVLGFARHRCQCPGSRRQQSISAKYVRRTRRFAAFVAERGIMRLSQAQSAERHEQVIAFETWLKQHRGISPLTISRHGRMIERLLPALGNEARQYTAGRVRCAIVDQAKQSAVKNCQPFDPECETA